MTPDGIFSPPAAPPLQAAELQIESWIDSAASAEPPFPPGAAAAVDLDATVDATVAWFFAPT